MTMKKLFLLLLPALALGAGSAHAQLQKGMKYWGATVNFSGEFSRDEVPAYDNEVNKTSRPAISPEAQLGWFVSDKVMLGVGLRYGLTYQKTAIKSSDFESRSLSQNLQLLPFIRRYFSMNDRWAIFIHGELGPNYSWSKVINKSIDTDKNDYWQYGLTVKPGVVYTFPNKKWSVEAYTNFLSLGFNYFPFPRDNGREITVSSGLNTNFPSYFSLRIARYIQPKN
ncbi:hypothetical protein Dfer_4896 [Dyadobacter fermentans DSM 18053]|uniref:Uncharacterized protein n=2 Tax=Dyadobacter fermentans TaxID=94254 RepID=C6W6N6_DYAFD|nr:hypothetical protein Dfer_4896 [Dyadobacter fermentans DSM 18053]